MDNSSDSGEYIQTLSLTPTDSLHEINAVERTFPSKVETIMQIMKRRERSSFPNRHWSNVQRHQGQRNPWNQISHTDADNVQLDDSQTRGQVQDSNDQSENQTETQDQLHCRRRPYLRQPHRKPSSATNGTREC